MSESDKPFSVNDRRHFTPEGRPRDEEPAEGENAAAGTSAARAEAPASPDTASTDTAPPSHTAPPSPGERTRPRGPSGPVDFSAFLMSLGAQAGLLLSAGGEAGGEGEDAAAALEGARQIIGILEMLQDKTQGRRTEQETRLLEDLLFQLRLAYVERSGSARP